MEETGFLGPRFRPPIFLYHFLATRNTSLAPSSQPLFTQPAIVSLGDWYGNRLRPFFDGVLLKPDDAADSRTFARFAIGLIVLATIHAFRNRHDQSLRRAMLSAVFLIFISSWVNEKAIPVPGGAWLAYDYRFSSTALAIGLALSGRVLIRLVPAATDNLRYKIFYLALAILSVLTSVGHLAEVRKAYKRYDIQARKYMAKIFKHEHQRASPFPTADGIPMAPSSNSMPVWRSLIAIRPERLSSLVM